MATFQASHRGPHTRRWVPLAVLCILLAAGVPWAFAQGAGGLADALFALNRVQDGTITRITGRLYGGRIRSQLYQRDDDNDTFSNDDLIAFELTPASGSRAAVRCDGSRSQFEDCLRQNVGNVLAILFPQSLSASVTGRDAAQYQAQQVLLTSALGTATSSEGGRLRRSEIGGLIEAEWFSDDNAGSGRAWQGFYRVKGGPVSFRGRFAELRQETITTNSILAGIGVQPSFLLNEGAQWRLGVDLRSGVIYSRSAALDLATLDLGGGVWSSFAKDFSRVRVGAGGVLQGSRGYVPTALVADSLDYIAEAINDTGILYDVAYGGLAGVILSKRTSLNAKILETRSLRFGGRPARHARDAREPVLPHRRTHAGGRRLQAVDGRRAGGALGVPAGQLPLVGRWQHMSPRTLRFAVVLLAGVLLAGTPARAQDTRKMVFMLGAAENELLVTAEYHDPADLDQRLKGTRVLPVKLTVRNITTRSVSLTYDDVRLNLDGVGVLGPADPEVVQRELRRTGRMPGLLGFLASQSSTFHRTALDDVRLRDGSLRPGQEKQGFVFFMRPDPAGGGASNGVMWLETRQVRATVARNEGHPRLDQAAGAPQRGRDGHRALELHCPGRAPAVQPQLRPAHWHRQVPLLDAAFLSRV